MNAYSYHSIKEETYNLVFCLYNGVMWTSNEQDLSDVTGIKKETFYESLGDFKQSVPEYIKKTVVEKGNVKGTPHENAFYVNSSDSLIALMRTKFEGKRVLTVSGSGEFSHAFINGGAEVVRNFDISAAAAFYSELRHVALCRLNMQDYIKLLDSWIKKEHTSVEGESEEETQVPFIDLETYKKVESLLSDEAKKYFEILFQTPELINAKPQFAGFVRVRFNGENENNRIVGEIIKNEDDYKVLQEKAKKTKFEQVVCDVNKMTDLASEFKPDTMYISNIGYTPKATFGIAKTYLDLGVPEVICTVSSHEVLFNDTMVHHKQGHKYFYFNDVKLNIGDKFSYFLTDNETLVETKIRVEVLGTDKIATHGLLLKVRKE